MNRFTWLRIVVKLLGLALVTWSIPSLAESAVATAYYYSQSPLTDYTWSALAIVPPLLQTAVGLYLLLGGNWIIRHCLHNIDTVCPACANDLSAVTTDSCPECGFRFRLPSPPAANS